MIKVRHIRFKQEIKIHVLAICLFQRQAAKIRKKSCKMEGLIYSKIITKGSNNNLSNIFYLWTVLFIHLIFGSSSVIMLDKHWIIFSSIFLSRHCLSTPLMFVFILDTLRCWKWDKQTDPDCSTNAHRNKQSEKKDTRHM